jgi:hypothetical protein
MSVSEAVDKGYKMLFDRDGVKMYHTSDLELRGVPLLKGTRDPQNRLFYFNFADPTTNCNVRVSKVEVYQPVSVCPLKLLPVVGPMNSEIGKRWFEESHLLREKNSQPLDLTSPEHVQLNLSRTYSECKSDYELWHPRLAHINPRLALIAKPDLKDWPRKLLCDDCTRGKFHKHSHSGKRPLAEELPWASGDYLRFVWAAPAQC